MATEKYFANVTKTKTFTYLFEPSLIMFYTDLVKNPLNSYANGIRIINVFLADLANTKFKVEDGVFHILCDLSQPDAMNQLEALKKSTFYEGCYLIKRNVGVILL